MHQGQKQKFIVSRKVGHNNFNGGGSEVSYHPYIGDGLKYLGDFWDNKVIETAAANHNGRNGLKNHPAPYPHSIVVPALLASTREGDLILDPFHGAGTTGDVATAFGRRYVGYDVYEYG